MLKTVLAFAVLLGLPLVNPACASASDAGKPADASKAQDVKPAKPEPADGKAWMQSASQWSELVGKPGNKEKECNGKSVQDFLKGKCNKLHGIDVRPFDRKDKPLPPAWGGDEFVNTEGFTQSGAPYQNVNPLFGIPGADNSNFRLKLPQEEKFEAKPKK